MRIITQTTPKMEKVTQKQRDKINSGTIDAILHHKHMSLPCMNQMELGGEGMQGKLPNNFRVIAWNLERCLKGEQSAQLLGRYSPDVILLSEMDNGMSRTKQKHTTKRLAKRLNMYYLYGVEFLELGLGNKMDKIYASDDFNKRGFHGNAILSKMPIEKVAMLRFNDHGHWFSKSNNDERRIGGRMALFALIKTSSNRSVCFVSTHFESKANIVERDKQLIDLINALRAFTSANTPVIIGGDLNTGNNLPDGQDHLSETLFKTAENYGYHWRANSEGTTTRASLLTRCPDRTMKLDWFCARDIESTSKQIIPALSDDQMPLSDHDPILADWQMR